VPIFATDPVITYMLCSMRSQAARLAYLPDYFTTLLKAAALNGGSFDAIEDPHGGDYEACAVLIPPGKRVDNPWTLLPAGFVGCLWRLGWGGCKVSLFSSCISDWLGSWISYPFSSLLPIGKEIAGWISPPLVRCLS
jgi:hypothetical protein